MHGSKGQVLETKRLFFLSQLDVSSRTGRDFYYFLFEKLYSILVHESTTMGHSNRDFAILPLAPASYRNLVAAEIEKIPFFLLDRDCAGGKV